jgi:hypothetical protein
MKKSKQANILIISTILLSACVPQNTNLNQSEPKPIASTLNNNSNETPKTNPSPITNNSININPTLEIKPTVTPSVVVENPLLTKVSFTSISKNDGTSGALLTIKGNNFITGKAKSIVFVNSSNTEIQSNISKMDNTEIVLSIPSNTILGIAKESLELSQSYHYVKVFIKLENGEKILVSENFKVLLSIPSSSSGSNSSGGSTLETNTSTNGNVTVVVNPSTPTTTEIKGTVGITFNPKEIKF